MLARARGTMDLPRAAALLRVLRAASQHGEPPAVALPLVVLRPPLVWALGRLLSGDQTQAWHLGTAVGLQSVLLPPALLPLAVPLLPVLLPVLLPPLRQRLR